MENRFNHLKSNIWLPFQKSWFIFENTNSLYEKNIDFFTKSSKTNPEFVYYEGPEKKKEEFKLPTQYIYSEKRPSTKEQKKWDENKK